VKVNASGGYAFLLAGGRITGLLSVVDQWIENVRAHAGQPEATARPPDRQQTSP
jgi:hypothetical protein